MKPIYDLTRKGRQFILRKEQQTAFEEIKHILIKPQVLHSLNSTGGFHLYSGTSKFAMGSALYQIQNGKPKLIAYASKRLPETARNYSITELEFCDWAVNIVSFSYLLKSIDSDAIVDHLASTHTIKSKAEPPTTRIKSPLEPIFSYSFNLYYIKGKDMVLSDFLSRKKYNDSNPHEIIPISFNMHNILHERYYNIGKSEKYLVQTWTQTLSSRIKLPEVHGVSKNLDPNIQPEKQTIRPLKGNEISQENPRIGQGRAGMGRRKPPINQPLLSQPLLNQPNNQR